MWGAPTLPMSAERVQDADTLLESAFLKGADGRLKRYTSLA